jgi:hypothetical protein
MKIHELKFRFSSIRLPNAKNKKLIYYGEQDKY